jgi:tetratricopeptide (TPR) repeat protein
MMRLDEALPPVDEAVSIFRDLGSRWELASALGDRGEIHRLAGRIGEAERDVREALDLCRRLGERNLIAWTASELVRVLLARGEIVAARELFDESSAWEEAADARATWLVTESMLTLAEGDRDRARELAMEVLEIDRNEGWPNVVASRTWWVGKLFGAEAVGGEAALEEAAKILEGAHWVQPLTEPDRVLQAEPS